MTQSRKKNIIATRQLSKTVLTKTTPRVRVRVRVRARARARVRITVFRKKTLSEFFGVLERF